MARRKGSGSVPRLGVIALVLSVLAGCSSGPAESRSDPGPTTTTAPDPTTTLELDPPITVPPTTALVQEALSLGEFTVTFHLADARTSISDPCLGHFTGGDAEVGAVFVIVPYTVENPTTRGISYNADLVHFANPFTAVSAGVPRLFTMYDEYEFGATDFGDCDDYRLRGDFEEGRGLIPGGTAQGFIGGELPESSDYHVCICSNLDAPNAPVTTGTFRAGDG
jgi:hypothetical protein